MMWGEVTDPYNQLSVWVITAIMIFQDIGPAKAMSALTEKRCHGISTNMMRKDGGVEAAGPLWH